jgi:hypothetical protein
MFFKEPLFEEIRMESHTKEIEIFSSKDLIVVDFFLKTNVGRASPPNYISNESNTLI